MSSKNRTGLIRKKAPVAPVHPVKAAHDKYMQDFSAAAANPTPMLTKRRDNSQFEFNKMNNMNMGGSLSAGSGVAG